MTDKENLECFFFSQAVGRDNKQRFSLLEEGGELFIRANQGHTVTVLFYFDQIFCTHTDYDYLKLHPWTLLFVYLCSSQSPCFNPVQVTHYTNIVSFTTLCYLVNVIAQCL